MDGLTNSNTGDLQASARVMQEADQLQTAWQKDISGAGGFDDIETGSRA